jgi:hypothetical protein
MKKLLVFHLLILAFLTNIAQPNFPKRGHVFVDSIIPKVYITVNPDSLAWLYANVNSDREFSANFVFEAGTDFDTVNNIGFRLRGNTSRYSQKKSFKISFNSFVKGQKYKGLEKMNLNGEHNDPSVIRSYLFWGLCHKMQVQGSRANHVEVYINGNYYGLYINVEHVDEQFIETRFGNNDGNLYKCLYGADFNYLDNNKQSYKNKNYTLVNNNETDDYSNLINTIKTLNESSSDELPATFEPIFNVNSFLRYLAVETFTGHWDAYSLNQNNYYLYENQYTGKIEFMPYDVDNTFGIYWFEIDLGTRNIYNWESDNKPLRTKILANQVYRDRFSFFLNQLITQYASPDSYFPFIEIVKERISPSAEQDTYRPLDYGWSYSDFLRSYTEQLGAHVKYGLEPYITARINSINQQIELNPIAPIIENVYHNFPSLSEQIKITANITDDEDNPGAMLYYSVNGSAVQSAGFVLQAEGNWLATIAPVSQSSVINYYLIATDLSGNTTREPSACDYQLKVGSSDVELAISEFMADNSTSVFDNYGQCEDWIEILNYGSSLINLKGKYLTDDFANKTKWAMPDTTIQPGAFYVVWADEDQKQGDNHANFKLGKGGEQIGIFDGLANNFTAIDTIRFGEQTEDKSLGLVNNIWQEQSFITPGGTNGDANYAFINFEYKMNRQIELGNFDSTIDFIDIAGTFNNWLGGIKLFDNDTDGVIRATLFGFSKDQAIEYKARINGTWSTCEFNELGGAGNRKYTVNAGVNNLSHWYNDEGLSVVEYRHDFLSIYPNPSQIGYIEVSDLGEEGTLFIYNLLGECKLRQNLNGESVRLETTTLSPGVYLVVFESIYNKKMVNRIVLNR